MVVIVDTGTQSEKKGDLREICTSGKRTDWEVHISHATTPTSSDAVLVYYDTKVWGLREGKWPKEIIPRRILEVLLSTRAAEAPIDVHAV